MTRLPSSNQETIERVVSSFLHDAESLQRNHSSDEVAQFRRRYEKALPRGGPEEIYFKHLLEQYDPPPTEFQQALRKMVYEAFSLPYVFHGRGGILRYGGIPQTNIDRYLDVKCGIVYIGELVRCNEKQLREMGASTFNNYELMKRQLREVHVQLRLGMDDVVFARPPTPMSLDEALQQSPYEIPSLEEFFPDFDRLNIRKIADIHSTDFGPRIERLRQNFWNLRFPYPRRRMAIALKKFHPEIFIGEDYKV